MNVSDMDSGPSCSGNTKNATCTSSLAHLPAELLVRVLRKLSPRQRFGGCALTCRALLAAAVAATEELQLTNISQQRADSIALWLAKHSSACLLRLDLEGSWKRSAEKLAVPFDRLTRLLALRLHCLALQTYPASSSSSSVSSCSQLGLLSCLQRLELTCLPEPACSSVMGGCTSASSSAAAVARAAATVAHSAVLGTALGQMVQLTQLSLSSKPAWQLGGLALALVSSLSKLQRLELERVGTAEHPVQLQGLPGSLTFLSFLDCGVDSAQELSICSQLSQLRHLELSQTDMPASVLLHMPQLHTLWLHASMEKHAVLAVLPQLQGLRNLSLDYVKGSAAAPDYAALTASSQLERLEWCMCGIAASATQHLFAAGRLLPRLHTISIGGFCENPWNPDDDEDEDGNDDALVLGLGGAARLAACCPGLQALGTLVVEADVTAADLLPLLQLSALTRLELGGDRVDDELAQQVLAKMTGLVYLDLMYCPNLTAQGCAHLTRLTALTYLKLQHNSALTAASDTKKPLDEYDSIPGRTLSLQSRVTPPNVWAKLQRLCMRNHAALAVMYQHALQHLAVQEQQLQQARQKIQELSQAV